MTNHRFPTKADAVRWFDAHLGARIDTVQAIDTVTTWSPPTRTLSKQFKSMWLLDGSTVSLTRQHTVEAITDDSVTLAWRAENGDLLHLTTYTVACEHMHTAVDDRTGRETCDQCEALVRQHCIVDRDHDGVTLWDCPCSECRGLRAHAAWTDA